MEPGGLPVLPAGPVQPSFRPTLSTQTMSFCRSALSPHWCVPSGTGVHHCGPHSPAQLSLRSHVPACSYLLPPQPPATAVYPLSCPLLLLFLSAPLLQHHVIPGCSAGPQDSAGAGFVPTSLGWIYTILAWPGQLLLHPVVRSCSWDIVSEWG